jgi:hypothetical protein
VELTEISEIVQHIFYAGYRIICEVLGFQILNPWCRKFKESDTVSCVNKQIRQPSLGISPFWVLLIMVAFRKLQDSLVLPGSLFSTHFVQFSHS